MTAAAYWSAAHLLNSTLQNELAPSLSRVPGSVTMYHLQLNIAQVAIGLGTSIVLLIIASTLAYRTASITALVDEFDPMHLTWLVVHNPLLSQRIAEIDVPSAGLLREAGMVDLAARRSQSDLDTVAATEYDELQQEDFEFKLNRRLSDINSNRLYLDIDFEN
ncbi:hypothetical protein DAEQUDRAFT_728914 [Daedalea quercina L-15889]|uniref:Uncharacterized protein n=1 Tax=Daedalea quercina L-15889 TaxID=1314783 RepID=A0A165P2D6_9APHY|nr:hypothetical protein DAEQUDRAFT_728914 [Daedalea quercina L-15889]